MTQPRFTTVACAAKRLGKAGPTVMTMIARGQLEHELLESGRDDCQVLVLIASLDKYAAAVGALQ